MGVMVEEVESGEEESRGKEERCLGRHCMATMARMSSICFLWQFRDVDGVRSTSQSIVRSVARQAGKTCRADILRREVDGIELTGRH